VNISNGFPVEDASKQKKKYLIPQGQTQPDEAGTISVMKGSNRIVRRITGTHPSSLGLHPGVYFYGANIRHQPTTVLAVAQLVADLEKADGFLDFTKHRKAFENFLVSHKMFINQLTVRHGSMVKGFTPIRDYYQFILERIRARRSEQEIEKDLAAHDKYQTLVKERPTPSRQAKQFSQDAKNVKLMTDVLDAAFVCKHCGARIDKKSMHLDHKVAKSHGGAADIDNSQWLHPYCDSTAKDKMDPVI
jgi:5-methylcytosine-specific restriction endonuclease McrA